MGRHAALARTYLTQALPSWELSQSQLSGTLKFDSLFTKSCCGYWLEIGFGYGEHLLQWVRDQPDIGMIGVEPFINGLAHCVKEIEKEPALYEGHLRLIPDDIRPFLPLFPRQSLDKIFVLFSDPWPKKRHAKRRLLTPSFLDTMTDLLKDGGELILAHDHFPYTEEIWGMLNSQKRLHWKAGIQSLDVSSWPAWPAAWPLTRYGKKALGTGRPLAFFVWQKH